MSDLDDISDYLESVSSEENAENFIWKLKKRFDRVVSLPNMGLPRDRIQAGLKVIFYHDYAIYYHIDGVGGRLIIQRVIHGARDLQKLIDTGGFERDDDEI